jgi:hypothetical protein
MYTIAQVFAVESEPRRTTAMRYECVHCDERFETEDTPRCPKCLRKHGLRKLDAGGASEAKAARRWAPLVIGVLVLAGVGYVTFLQRSELGLGPAPMEAAEREAQAAGAPPAELARMLAADAKVEAFARAAGGGASTPVDKAKAIAKAIAGHAARGAFIPWSRADVRDGAGPLPAAEVLAKLQKSGGRARLYPIELAVLGVTVLRVLDVSAHVVEVFAFPGERAPLDPSGRIGYFAVAVTGSPGTAPTIVDVYGGREAAPKPGDYTVLEDAQLLGAALSLRALHKLVNDSDTATALTDADVAIKLAPSSPTVRGVRGAVLLASGGTGEGERELEAAAQLRADSPRRNNVAMLALAKGDADRAAKETALALAEAPDYAAGHLTLASVHMSRGETDMARAELEHAERIDATLPALSIAWAEWYAGRGDLAMATQRAESAVRARPKSPETRLVLARIYRAASRFDDMRAQARAIFEAMPAGAKERTRSLLLNVLGPTALEAPTTPTDATAPTTAGGSPSLSTPTDLQLGAGEPKLRLGAGSGKLKLNLSD